MTKNVEWIAEVFLSHQSCVAGVVSPFLLTNTLTQHTYCGHTVCAMCAFYFDCSSIIFGDFWSIVFMLVVFVLRVPRFLQQACEMCLAIIFTVIQLLIRFLFYRFKLLLISNNYNFFLIFLIFLPWFVWAVQINECIKCMHYAVHLSWTEGNLLW